MKIQGKQKYRRTRSHDKSPPCAYRSMASGAGPLFYGEIQDQDSFKSLRQKGVARYRSSLGSQDAVEPALVGRNFSTGVHHVRPTRMGKDAVYRFLSSSRSNWRRFLGLLAQTVINGLFMPQADEKREIAHIGHDRVQPECTVDVARELQA